MKQKKHAPAPVAPPVSALVDGEKACETCRFYIEFSGESSGDCVRYPPTVFLMPSGTPKSFFPEVDAALICGEHKPRG